MKEVDEIWGLFEAALDYSVNKSVASREYISKFFDLLIYKKGYGNSKITMGLYWIASDSFLNIDSRNTWYIYESQKLPSDLVNSLPKIKGKIPASQYFDIVEKIREYLNSGRSEFKDFKDLSSEAWRYSEQVNQENKIDSQGSLSAKQANRDNAGTALADEDVDTVHYWIYSPGDSAFKWDEFYKKDIIGIGWSELGDLSQYDNKNDVKQAMKEKINSSKNEEI